MNYTGEASKTYRSDSYGNADVIFTIEPKTGDAFVTEFTLKVDKSPAGVPLKCEFGYNNGLGDVVLPTVDTRDVFDRSQKDKSTFIFNKMDTEIKAAFPLNDVEYDGPR